MNTNRQNFSLSSAAQMIKAQTRTFPNFWALPRTISLDWSYASTDKRDLRLDLLRGFAVIVMVVNHFGGSSWLYLITGGDAFFVSGAEAFIFISGLVVGMVYGGIALKQGLWAAQLHALKRALTLYKLTVALTFLFTAFSIAFSLPWVKDLQIDNPFIFAFNVLTLRQTLYLTDIPLLYTLLMVSAAGALFLLIKGHTRVLLVGSFALWLAFQLFPAEAQIPWPIQGNTTFNFAAWQFLFFGAMAIGYHRESISRKLSQVPRWTYFFFLSILMVWLTELHATQGTVLAGLIPGLDIPAFMHDFFLKSALAPGRLIASFVVFQFAFFAVTLFWKPISAALNGLLMPLGQNALYAYTMHILIIGAFNAVLPHTPFNMTTMGTLNTSLQILVVLAIWVMIQRRFLFRIIPR